MSRFSTFLLLAALAGAQPAIHLKTGRIELRTGSPVDELHSPRPPEPGHLIVQFETPPSPAAIAALKNRGVRVLADVPQNAVLISLDRRISVHDLRIRYAAPIKPQDKISPIAASGFNVIEFHPDVDLNAARAIVLAAGIELRDNPDLDPHHLLVRANISRLEELARQDEVAYIFPASDGLVSGRATRPCAGALTTNGAVAQSIPTVGTGWDGPALGSATIGYVSAA